MFRFVLDAADAQSAGTVEPIVIALMIAGFFIVYWFLFLHPQRKKEKELKKQLDGMHVGDTVVTIGGLTGKVANIREDEVTIMTSAANTLVTFKKSAIGTVISRDAKPENTEKPEEKKKEKLILKKKEKDTSDEENTEESKADAEKNDNPLGKEKD